MGKKGITILELTVYGSLVVTVFTFMGLGLKSVWGTYQFLITQGQVQSEQTNMIRHLFNIGRVARDCTKEIGLDALGNTLSISLNCQVNFEKDGIGSTSRVRFIKFSAENELHYEMESSVGVWERKKSYGGNLSHFSVNTFDLCGPTELLGADPACSFPPFDFRPQKITDRFILLNTPPNPNFANRFFRFRIEAETIDSMISLKRTYQSSFFVRNPTRIPALFYRAGNWE